MTSSVYFKGLGAPTGKPLRSTGLSSGAVATTIWRGLS